MIENTLVETTLNIVSISFHEPVTGFTDFIISIFCFMFFIKLKNVSVTVKFWRNFFLFFGISTIFGGSSHLFFTFQEHDTFSYKSVWFTNHLVSIVSVYYAQQATLVSILKNNSKKHLWKWSYVIQFVLFSISVFVFQNFLVVILNIAVGLFPVMVLHLKNKNENDTNELIAYGIGISFLTALINGTKISASIYFNYKDIAHVLIMISLSVMFLGIKNLRADLNT